MGVYGSSQPLEVFASAARTAAHNSADFASRNCRGLHLIIDATAAVASPGVTFTIQGKDPVSGVYYTLLTSAAITGTGTTVLRVYPGCVAAANTIANDALPGTWRVAVTVADADSLTYSVGAWLIP